MVEGYYRILLYFRCKNIFVCFPADENYLLEYFVTLKNFHNERLEERKFYGMKYGLYLHIFCSVPVTDVSLSLLFSCHNWGYASSPLFQCKGWTSRSKGITIVKCTICCYSFTNWDLQRVVVVALFPQLPPTN